MFPTSRFLRLMSKHARSPSPHGPVPGGASGLNPTKKPRIEAQYLARKIATPEAAARVDADPPFAKLLRALKETTSTPAKGSAVLYWMRMQDLRSTLPTHLYQPLNT
jgi:hypothetical protein